MDAQHDRDDAHRDGREPDERDAALGDGTVEQIDDVEVVVRRSPRYGRFMAVGAVLGVLVAWLSSLAALNARTVTPDAAGSGQDTTPVIGLMLVVGFVAGGALGGLVAVLIDRALSRRTTTTVAEHLTVERPDARRDADAPAADWRPTADDDPAGRG